MQTRLRNRRSRGPASITRFLVGLALALGMTASLSAAAAEGSTTAEDVGHGVGSTMHDIGTGARDAGKEVGQAAGKAGKAIGHTARDAAVVTWDAMKRTGITIGHTVRDGSKAFVRGIKGEPER
ncbi:hypothetical protein [Aromatoleum evansii]|uniref:hypothetical protein n=1 Tax=Aromatoleum evansii TaxID=59406 RepID=UPI00145E52F8|nr:hypothetical protein [Aromatoleum evansii]NMG29382.1 hypothetical protein [Aromatoleum evansii]